MSSIDSFVLIESLNSILSLSTNSSPSPPPPPSPSSLSSPSSWSSTTTKGSNASEVEDIQITEYEEEKGYKVLTNSQIMDCMNGIVNNIEEVTHLSTNVVWNLIHIYRWDKTHLLVDWFDKKELLLQKYNLMSDENDFEMDFWTNCSISKNTDSIFGMDCYHCFSKEFWNNYLINKIGFATHVKDITCADTSCQRLLDSQTVFILLDDMSVKDKYIELAIKSFVDYNQNFRFCLKKECGKVIWVKIVDTITVECECETRMCFKCGQSSHYPIVCDLIHEWSLRMCSNLNQTIVPQFYFYRRSYSRLTRCPDCQTIIEIFGNVNYPQIVCTVCSKHFDPNQVKKPFDRFNKFLTKFKEINEWIEKEKSFELTPYVDVVKANTISQSMNELYGCLRYTQLFYIFVYFTERSTQMQIFEHNLCLYERYVQSLTEVLVKMRENSNFVAVSKLMGLIRNCHQYRQLLIDHIVEGEEKDYWTYSFNDDIEIYWLYNQNNVK